MMNKELTSRLILMSLLCMGLGVSACKKEADSEEPTTDEVTEETPTEEEKPAGEETPTEEEKPAEEEKPVAEEKPAVDQALYIKALYEVTCVTGRIEDVEKQKSIIDEVYARYGFDADSFAAAKDQLKGDAGIDSALKIRMEKCTSVEVAEAFAKAVDTTEEEKPGEEEKPKDEVKKPTRKFSTSGSYTQRGMRLGSFNQGELRLTFNSKNKVNGQFKIKADGVLVKIPLKGSISKSGSFSASGSKGANNNLRVSGKATTKAATGKLSGKINSKSVNTSMNARK